MPRVPVKYLALIGTDLPFWQFVLIARHDCEANKLVDLVFEGVDKHGVSLVFYRKEPVSIKLADDTTALI